MAGNRLSIRAERVWRISLWGFIVLDGHHCHKSAVITASGGHTQVLVVAGSYCSSFPSRSLHVIIGFLYEAPSAEASQTRKWTKMAAAGEHKLSIASLYQKMS